MSYSLFNQILLIISFQFIITKSHDENKYTSCHVHLDNTGCLLSDVFLTKENYHFTPFADEVNSDQIKKVRILSGEVPKLGGCICNAFNNLDEINLYNLGLEEITEEAFRNCKELTSLVLTKNKLSQLEPNVFSVNTKLAELYVTDNQLDERVIDALPESLKILQLGDNKLKSFTLNKTLPNLRTLILTANELTDLDTGNLIQNLPELQNLFINDNDFKCDRLQQIRDEFKSKGVTVSERFNEANPKQRSQIVETRDGFICIP